MHYTEKTCSGAKHSTLSTTDDARQASESSLNQLQAVEACIVDLFRLNSLIVMNGLIDPFPDEHLYATDPYDIIDNVRNLMSSFEILHAQLTGKEVCHA